MDSAKYLNVLLVLLWLKINLGSNEISTHKRNLINLIQHNLIHTTRKDEEEDFIYQVPDENWTASALKDIAYFLRNQKFNDWDRRYYKTKPIDELVGFYKAFPSKPLKVLHWKVNENCYKNFHKCIIYLHNVIETIPFRRTDDIITTINANMNSSIEISTKMKIDNECKDALLNSDKTGVPFDGPLEKFQWYISASYFMCWYTMLGTPALSMLEERCDNFASCLDPVLGARNRDPRADDSQSFVCAMYSFCPDACCPVKFVKNMTQCHVNKANPCLFGNNTNNFNNICKLDRKNNQNFEDIMKNIWNTTCYCSKGFEWKTEFGMCVDINECLFDKDNCDIESEECLNLPGSFQCICKWNFHFNNKTKSCIKV